VTSTEVSILDAVRELGRAQKLAPDSLAIAGDFGRALAEIGAWEEAEGEAKKILAREPANVLGQYIRAAALLGRAKPEEALAILDALPKAGALPDIEPARAQALISLGKTAEGEQLRVHRDPVDRLHAHRHHGSVVWVALTGSKGRWYGAGGGVDADP